MCVDAGLTHHWSGEDACPAEICSDILSPVCKGKRQYEPPCRAPVWERQGEGLCLFPQVLEDMQEKETVTPERAEEAKLKAKYPNLGQKPGGSDFLMKRLQKGQKYFDSGDYNMAKAKMKNKQLPSAGPDKNLVTGDHIPTPQDLPQRKSSLVTSKLAG
ncbi:alpha-endosulfine isoform X1 [Strix aluco]|uniref:alpha-endosulfine isoform X1 n=1 Tax=Strix aluco TaxID=111821 RepID=UPI003DA3F1F8